MKDKLGKVFMERKDTFEAVLHKFKINHKRNSDFIIKASEEFKEAVYKLFERIINNETIPQNFTDTTLHQIWKRKPGTKKEDMSANRYIHCEEWLPMTLSQWLSKRCYQRLRRLPIYSRSAVCPATGRRSTSSASSPSWSGSRSRRR